MLRRTPALVRTPALARAWACLPLLALCACTSLEDDAPVTQSQAPVVSPSPTGVGGQQGDVTHYVALGDSYAALGSTNLGYPEPVFCQRSPDNYPAQLAAELRRANPAEFAFVDATCQGGVTADMLAPRHATREDPTSAAVPPQVDALSAETDLVTLSIGGNDIGFGAIARCFGESILTGQPSECASQHEEDVAAALADLPAALDGVYAAIAERAPQARIVATEYMPLLTADDACPQIAGFSDADQAWAAGLIDELNGVVAAAAARHGATAVLPKAAAEHTGCAPADQRWVAFLGLDTNAAPMHPTAAGQRAMADAIESAL